MKFSNIKEYLYNSKTNEKFIIYSWKVSEPNQEQVYKAVLDDAKKKEGFTEADAERCFGLWQRNPFNFSDLNFDSRFFLRFVFARQITSTDCMVDRFVDFES